MSTDDERWLRDTLDDAVRDVEPRRGLDDIAASLRSRPRRVAPWAAAGAGLLVAATIGGIALAGGLWSDEPQPPPAGPVTPAAPGPSPGREQSPEQSPERSPEQSPGKGPHVEAGVGMLPLYYVGDTPAGPRLYREFRGPARDGDPLTVAVDMAVWVQPLDPDYRTAWPEGTAATASRLQEPGDVVQVDLESTSDLSARPDGTSADEARMAIQQVVHTAQAVEQRPVRVVFAVHGRPVDTLMGEPVRQPVSAADPMQVLAPVWIIDPAEGAATGGRLRVSGRGAFFEATVAWQVLDAGTGQVVREGAAMAQECCTLSPFSFTLPRLPVGQYVLRVYDANVSGGEGSGEQADTKSFVIH